MKVLMLAAENGALPQGKVGGMGDVIRDLPRAIVGLGHEVTVLTPGYGMFAGLPGAEHIGTLNVPFAGNTERVDWYRVAGEQPGLTHEFLEHPRFSPHGPGRIYCDDGPDSPFFSDATKFAFFSAGAAHAAQALAPDVVHLHDWHTGFYVALRQFDRRFARLRKIRTVFTIHNLALQGTRPYADTDSSWWAWYPWLRCDPDTIADPIYPGCVNPLATAVRYADMITTVSPTYAGEIVRPNDVGRGFHGGEGLEDELARADREGRLCGILNGCDYTAARRRRRTGWKKFVDLLTGEVRTWMAREPQLRSAHFLALERIGGLPRRRPGLMLTSVGRVTPQKVALLQEPISAGVSALDALLQTVGDDALFVMVGSGEPGLERFLTEAAVRHANLLFLNGYSETLADALYASGDLFLMPSSYEPCGISQMFALRAGQPCVVHGVGGLKDTVTARTGFVFEGNTPAAQASAFVRAVESAAALQRGRSPRWGAMRAAAAAERFDWDLAARRYVGEAYVREGR